MSETLKLTKIVVPIKITNILFVTENGMYEVGVHENLVTKIKMYVNH